MPLLCKGPECPDYYETDNGMQAYAQDCFKFSPFEGGFLVAEIQMEVGLTFFGASKSQKW